MVAAINALVHDGMTTKEIYRKAFALLRKGSNSAAARYKLKTAIMELGPAGFAFEKFVAALLKEEGYATRTGQMVQGKCVKHEVDVIAERGDVRCMIECKFHSDKGNYSDVKVPMYIRSRFEDVSYTWQTEAETPATRFEGWVVTNTRFTTDAEQYGNCAGLKLISWDMPQGQGIKDRIDRSGLHPITSLTTLTLSEKKSLLDMDVVLCSELNQSPQLLHKVGMSKLRSKKTLKEAQQLCQLYRNGNGE
ncbi:MAG: hypothetical protein RL266_1400 [Bacteroidota bacterium]